MTASLPEVAHNLPHDRAVSPLSESGGMGKSRNKERTWLRVGDKHSGWVAAIPYVPFQLRTREHGGTGLSLAEVLLGRQLTQHGEGVPQGATRVGGEDIHHACSGGGGRNPGIREPPGLEATPTGGFGLRYNEDNWR